MFRFVIPVFVMASKEDIGQIKKTLQELRKGQLDILLKLEVAAALLYFSYTCEHLHSPAIRMWRIA